MWNKYVVRVTYECHAKHLIMRLRDLESQKYHHYFVITQFLIKILKL